MGAILVVGGVGLLDLRLLGYGRRLDPAALSRAVTPLALAGFAIMAVSGALMFVADSEALAGSTLFQVKLVLIGLAGANALAFRRMFRVLSNDIPPAARLLGAGSLGLWLGVVVLGRLIAYF
ncbi:hypothetical protein [Brevundimonas balnearis]|uniref:Copper resistance protein D domain-containing protein n=1 Tax=Brevundimonas balnearis TaxID=1572858 RepID=A0ABV6R1Q8_9CAUL